MESVLILVAGIFLGTGLAYLVYRLLGRRQQSGLRETLGGLLPQVIRENTEHLHKVLRETTDHLLQLNAQTLSDRLSLGEKDLEGKKRLIDQTLNQMADKLQDVQKVVVQLEKDREHKFGQLTSQLQEGSLQLGRLQQTTEQLRSALASTRARGQWGERMAEDVLRLAGFIENVNYVKNRTMDTTSKRPDYSFILPRGLKVNMDVKFPLDNYLRYLEADSDTEKDHCRKLFFKDVRNRIKEVPARGYIDPEDNTVDYAIVFIPNEQVYAFIHEFDRSLLDEALKSKVVVCSPLTLYAVLAVIRQAVDNFNLERTANQILSLLGVFHKQWTMFTNSFDRVGKRIEDAQKEFHALSTTRRNQLEKPLQQIDDLRRRRGMGGDGPSEGDELDLPDGQARIPASRQDMEDA